MSKRGGGLLQYGEANDGTPLFWQRNEPSGQDKVPGVLLISGGGFHEIDIGKPMTVCGGDTVAAGYLSVSPEYRLAPPGKLPGQTSLGRFPDQYNDVIVAARALKNDPKCNGQVFAIGGSAGGTHALWLALSSEISAAVALSPATQFDDATSLKNSTFNHDVTNYATGNLAPASPNNNFVAGQAPVFIVAFSVDHMPAPQFTICVADLEDMGLPCQSLLLPGSGHSFDAWPSVKTQAISFLNSYLE